MDHSLPQIADPIPPATAPAAGRRPEAPQFTDDPMLDRLYGVTMALIAELAVTRARLDALERELARRQVIEGETVDAFIPDPEDAAARAKIYQDYLDRVLRPLRD